VCYNTQVMRPIHPATRLAIIVAALVCTVSCSESPPPVDPAYVAEIEEWRKGRIERLTADDGWLTLTGLYWLGRGHNAFGSGDENPIVLPDASLPLVAGSLVVGDNGVVIATAEPMAKVFVDGKVISETILRTDADGSPDVVSAGRIRFYVIDREGRLAARVKDPKAPALAEFKGIEYFPIDPSFRVEAHLEAYEEPRDVAIPTVLGEDATMTAPGLLHFTINGVGHTLEPYLSGPDNGQYFLIFRDATSTVTTYGAGRYLYTSAVDTDGTTVLDFNLAYNPPCAYTPFATCPLPPPQNWLSASIEAGEKYTGEAH
jgi:uncharacterized protein (DUF1684 family)